MFLLLAASLAQAPADPPPPPAVTQVKLADPAKAAEVRTPVGVPVRLTAGGKPARWEAGCESAGKTWHLIPDPDGRGATVVASKPGRYLVLATAAAGDVASPAARTLVVAGDPEPEPSPPPPAPAPPPVPPAPAPPPVEPFVAKLRAAYAADPGADKAGKALTLASVYRLAAKYAATDPTAAALVERVRQASVSLDVAPADLAEVRKLVAAELAAAAPPDRPFDAAARAALAAAYLRAAAGLTGLN